MLGKQKKEIDDEEKERLQEYMIEKRMRIENEKHAKDIDTHQEFERKRRNLEKLFSEIRYHREQEIQNKKKTKKMKKKKSKKFIAPQPSPVSGMEEEQLPVVFDDESYSALYKEYKKILSKKNTKENIEAHMNNIDFAQEERRSQKEEMERKQIRKENKKRQQVANKKKEEIQQKFLELTDRYQRSLIQNIQALENNINSSSKRVSPAHVRSGSSSAKLREEEKSTSVQRFPYESRGYEGQHVIREINSDNNISETDYLSPEQHLMNEKIMQLQRHEHEEEESDRVYDSEGNLLEESAREIIEAAAIFIQKNYRGYRTRKLLPMILAEIYGYPFEYQDEDYQGEGDYDEEGHVEEHEEEEDEEEEGQLLELEEGDYAYERAHEKVPRTIDKRVLEEHLYEYQREHQQVEEEEVEYTEEEVTNPVYFDEHEKKTIRHLLEKQKKQRSESEIDQQEEEEEQEDLHHIQGDEDEVEYNEQDLNPEEGEYDQEEESQQYMENYDMYKQALENIGRGAPVQTEVTEEKQRESEQQEFEEGAYDEEDILRMQYQLQQLKEGGAYEEESEDFETIQINKRSKSDGELLDRRFEGDYDMEDSDQVSLHDDGEIYLGEHQDYGRGGYGMHKPQGFIKEISMVFFWECLG